MDLIKAMNAMRMPKHEHLHKKCAGICPGLNPCILELPTYRDETNDVYSRKPHEWHICEDVDCYCHSRERYANERIVAKSVSRW